MSASNDDGFGGVHGAHKSNSEYLACGPFVIKQNELDLRERNIRRTSLFEEYVTRVIYTHKALHCLYRVLIN